MYSCVSTGSCFLPKFSSRPPTYICSENRVDWKIAKFIPDCSPVKKTAVAGQCPPGWEARDSYCVACPPGMYRNKAPLCQLCPKSTFSSQYGSSSCHVCPSHHRTVSLGSRKATECIRGRLTGRGHHVREQSPSSIGGSHTSRRGRLGRGKVLAHYNSWLNEQPYRQRHG